MKLRNLNLLNGKVLRAIGWVASLGLLIFSSSAHAQSPSPFAIETNVHGVYAYTQPPAGFNPSTASATELQLYGYPPRPAANESAEALATWAAVVNPALTRVVPQLVHTNIFQRPVSGLVMHSAKAATSSNWSGFAVVQKETRVHERIGCMDGPDRSAGVRHL